MKTKPVAHRATPETVDRIYEFCRCGAVRHRKGPWHVCGLCSTGLPCFDETLTDWQDVAQSGTPFGQ